MKTLDVKTALKIGKHVFGVVGFANWAFDLTARQSVLAVVIRKRMCSASHWFSLSGALVRLQSVGGSKRAPSSEGAHLKAVKRINVS